jgi:hypothetical protein
VNTTEADLAEAVDEVCPQQARRGDPSGAIIAQAIADATNRTVAVWTILVGAYRQDCGAANTRLALYKPPALPTTTHNPEQIAAEALLIAKFITPLHGNLYAALAAPTQTCAGEARMKRPAEMDRIADTQNTLTDSSQSEAAAWRTPQRKVKRTRAMPNITCPACGNHTSKAFFNNGEICHRCKKTSGKLRHALGCRSTTPFMHCYKFCKECNHDYQYHVAAHPDEPFDAETILNDTPAPTLDASNHSTRRAWSSTPLTVNSRQSSQRNTPPHRHQMIEDNTGSRTDETQPAHEHLLAQEEGGA